MQGTAEWQTTHSKRPPPLFLKEGVGRAAPLPYAQGLNRDTLPERK